MVARWVSDTPGAVAVVARGNTVELLHVLDGEVRVLDPADVHPFLFYSAVQNPQGPAAEFSAIAQRPGQPVYRPDGRIPGPEEQISVIALTPWGAMHPHDPARNWAHAEGPTGLIARRPAEVPPVPAPRGAAPARSGNTKPLSRTTTFDAGKLGTTAAELEAEAWAESVLSDAGWSRPEEGGRRVRLMVSMAFEAGGGEVSVSVTTKLDARGCDVLFLTCRDARGRQSQTVIMDLPVVEAEREIAPTEFSPVRAEAPPEDDGTARTSARDGEPASTTGADVPVGSSPAAETAVTGADPAAAGRGGLAMWIVERYDWAGIGMGDARTRRWQQAWRALDPVQRSAIEKAYRAPNASRDAIEIELATAAVGALAEEYFTEIRMRLPEPLRAMTAREFRNALIELDGHRRALVRERFIVPDIPVEEATGRAMRASASAAADFTRAEIETMEMLVALAAGPALADAEYRAAAKLGESSDERPTQPIRSNAPSEEPSTSSGSAPATKPPRIRDRLSGDDPLVSKRRDMGRRQSDEPTPDPARRVVEPGSGPDPDVAGSDPDAPTTPAAGPSGRDLARIPGIEDLGGGVFRGGGFLLEQHSGGLRLHRPASKTVFGGPDQAIAALRVRNTGDGRVLVGARRVTESGESAEYWADCTGGEQVPVLDATKRMNLDDIADRSLEQQLDEAGFRVPAPGVRRLRCGDTEVTVVATAEGRSELFFSVGSAAVDIVTAQGQVVAVETAGEEPALRLRNDWVETTLAAGSCKPTRSSARRPITLADVGLPPATRRTEDTAEILASTGMNGHSKEWLERRMRPGIVIHPDGFDSSEDGFLGFDDDLNQTRARDNDLLAEVDCTHADLVDALRLCAHLIEVWGLDRFALAADGVTYTASRSGHQSSQRSPFGDDSQGWAVYTVTNTATGAACMPSELGIHLVDKYFFYQGPGTSFRMYPEDVIRTFGYLLDAVGGTEALDTAIARVNAEYGWPGRSEFDLSLIRDPGVAEVFAGLSRAEQEDIWPLVSRDSGERAAAKDAVAARHAADRRDAAGVTGAERADLAALLDTVRSLLEQSGSDLGGESDRIRRAGELLDTVPDALLWDETPNAAGAVAGFGVLLETIRTSGVSDGATATAVEMLYESLIRVARHVPDMHVRNDVESLMHEHRHVQRDRARQFGSRGAVTKRLREMRADFEASAGRGPRDRPADGSAPDGGKIPDAAPRCTRLSSDLAVWDRRVAELSEAGTRIIAVRGADSVNGIDPADMDRIVSYMHARIEEVRAQGFPVALMYDGDADDRATPDVGAVFGMLADTFAADMDVSFIAAPSAQKYSDPAGGPICSAMGTEYETYVFDDVPDGHSNSTQSASLVGYAGYEQAFVGAVGPIAAEQLRDLGRRPHSAQWIRSRFA